MKQKRNGKRFIANFIWILLFASLGLLTVYGVYLSGKWPAGSNAMAHVYKGAFLYKQLLKGNWYPLLDMNWYNGVEPFRYLAPLPTYGMAGCIALMGGNVLYGYLAYIFVLFFLGAMVWLLIGNRVRRIGLSGVLGILWFILPNNLYTVFQEGNLSRALAVIGVPWLVYKCYSYIEQKRSRTVLAIALTFMFLVLCDLEYAGMIFLAFFLFALVYGVFCTALRKTFHCLLSMLIGAGLAGVWLYPAIMGRMEVDNTQIMAGYFQPLFKTLNPVLRLQGGSAGYVYFGIATFLIVLSGIIAGRGKTRPFFVTTLILLLLTSSSVYPILARLPRGDRLWMLRFVSIAIAFAWFAFLQWRTLRGRLVLLAGILLLADSVPSLGLVYGYLNGRDVEARLEKQMEETLLAKAKSITNQRLAIMDLGEMESTGIYLASMYQSDTDISFGDNWQTASTANNVMLLNQSMQNGAYTYLFDRALGLGNDTILVQSNLLQYGSTDIPLLDAAAEKIGYELTDFNETYRLYHMDTPKQFGVKTNYTAIGIGAAAKDFSLCYPSMKETDSSNINDYSVEELKAYQVIYLDGFTYSNKERAEAMLKELADYGVRIVISGNGVPIDPYTGVQSFLGVICQPIQFSNGYPIMDTVLGIIDPSLFPSGFTKWKSVYLEGLDTCYGKVNELGKEIAFLGTAGGKENIIVMGFSLSYHYSLTGDKGIGALLDFAMQLDPEECPTNTIVPLEVSYGTRQIRIHSEEELVNTTLAYHDMFRSSQAITRQNHLLYVSTGDTVITMNYPYLKEGIAVSVAAWIILIFYMIGVHALWRRREIKAVDVFGIPRPVAGQLPKVEWMTPEGAKYLVEELVWKHFEGTEMEPEEEFTPGKYTVCVMVTVNGDERFAKQLDVLINNLQPDALEREEDIRLYAEMTFTATETFKFIEQPKDGMGYVGESYPLTWQISQPAKVAYLQVFEFDRWIISSVLPCEANVPLSYFLESDMIGKVKYRMTYILNNGQTSYSDEFVIDWIRGKNMRVLVTGVKGQLGHDVVNELEKRGMEAVGVDIEEMDITDAASVERVITESKVDAVIHCAAYTAVDAAEDNEAVCRKINVEGTENIVKVCKDLDIKMMYISTDYVFDGEGTRPWEPDDKNYAPQNVYGQSKLDGELAVSSMLEKFFIVRIAWVFGLNGKNFIKTMINVGKTHDTVRVVNDQIGTPTYTYDLARLLVDMIASEKYGYYHATNEGGYISWYDFTCEIYKQAGMDVKVIPVTTEEYGLSKAKRPYNSRLDKSKLVENGFEPLPTWQDAVARYVSMLE